MFDKIMKICTSYNKQNSVKFRSKFNKFRVNLSKTNITMYRNFPIFNLIHFKYFAQMIFSTKNDMKEMKFYKQVLVYVKNIPTNVLILFNVYSCSFQSLN